MAIGAGAEGPLSAQIRADIEAKIRSGTYAVGDKIPSLKTMSAEYDVAELTVHTAVKDLQARGVLRSEGGRGTYVRAVPDDVPADPVAELRATVERLDGVVAELKARVEAIEAGQS